MILCSLYAASAAGTWFLQSQSDQGTRWLERAIAAAPDPTDAIRAQALLALGAVRSQQQQLDLAQDLANDALHMYKRLGDRVGEAHCLNGLGLAAIDAGRSDEAEELLKTTVAICEETRDAQAREVFLLNMGVVCLDRGDWARARDIFAENLSFARANHDDLDVAMSSENLGEAHLSGEPEKAAAGQRGPAGRRPGRVPSARSARRRACPGLAGQEGLALASQLRRLPPSPEPASHPPPKPCWTRPQQS